MMGRQMETTDVEVVTDILLKRLIRCSAFQRHWETILVDLLSEKGETSPLASHESVDVLEALTEATNAAVEAFQRSGWCVSSKQRQSIWESTRCPLENRTETRRISSLPVYSLPVSSQLLGRFLSIFFK